MRAVLAAALAALAAPACDVEAGAVGDAVRFAAETRDGPHGGDTSEETTPAPDVQAPSPSGEQLLARATDGDDLFPSLADNDLAWTRVTVDRSQLTSGQDPPNCLSCPYCVGCASEIHYRRLPDGEEHVLAVERGVRSAPQVGDGRVFWLTGDGAMRLYDIASRQTQSLTTGDYYWGSLPVLASGSLWLYGYVDGQWGLVRVDPATGKGALQVSASMDRSGWWSDGGLNGLGARQPFALGSRRVAWLRWQPITPDDTSTYGYVVHDWKYGDADAPAVALEPERDYLRVLLTAKDTLVTASYLRANGCGLTSCTLALKAYSADGDPRELAPGFKPSVFLAPVVSGERVAWVDRRDGLYQIWYVDASRDAAPVRVTSEIAEVGTLSTITAGPRGIVWSDHRSGHWQLYLRAW